MTRKNIAHYAKKMRLKWQTRSRKVMLTRLQTLEHEHRLAAVEAIEIGVILRHRPHPEAKAILEQLLTARKREEEVKRLGISGRVLRWVGWKT
jgi:hypothetical protein